MTQSLRTSNAILLKGIECHSKLIRFPLLPRTISPFIICMFFAFFVHFCKVYNCYTWFNSLMSLSLICVRVRSTPSSGQASTHASCDHCRPLLSVSHSFDTAVIAECSSLTEPLASRSAHWPRFRHILSIQSTGMSESGLCLPHVPRD